MKTTTKLLTLAVLVGGMLLPSIVNAQGLAPQLCTDFDSFNLWNNPKPGSLRIRTVHGQDGWTPVNLNGGWTVSDMWGFTMLDSGTSGWVDEEVVAVPGGKAWRISNARDFGGAFSSQPFSPIVPDALVAGETGAYLYNNFGPDSTAPWGEPANKGRMAQTKHFCASFDFKSETDGAQVGLKIEIDASAKQSSARYAWMRVEDNNGAGLDFNTDGGYAATGLSYNEWHHVKMEIEFVDGLNPDGSGNDIVTITVDGGTPIVTTTWEDYYAASQPSRYPHAVDSLMFRIPGSSAVPALLGHGLLIDNVCVACPLAMLAIACPPDVTIPTDPGKCEASLTQIGTPTVTGGVNPVRVAPFIAHEGGSVTLSGGFQAGNLPEVWDLTASDLIITATYDGTGMKDVADAHAWSELGVREEGQGNFNPAPDHGVWLATDYPYAAGSLAPSPNALALNDKLILQKQGGIGEGDYNLPSTPPNPWANYGLWFDRDGIDPSQALMWGMINGKTYNTRGLYDVQITLHATGPNSGTAYMTVNGVYQGFYVPDYHAGQPDLYPAGMTFSGDMTKMQVFYGIYGYGATHEAKFENIRMLYTPQSLPTGTTPVLWVATDAAGYSVSCVQQVTVKDQEPPTITCPADLTVSTDAGKCSASGVALGSPITGDNCGVASVGNNALTVFPKGTTTVTWTVTDTSGNTATCNQTVVVGDREKPVFTCSGNIVANSASAAGSTVSWPTIVATDNCDGTVPVTCTPASGSIFPIGVATVTCSATDIAGNTATCSFTVTVVGPNPMKQAVLVVLQGLTPPSDKGDANKLNDAIKNLQKSLDPKLWIDATHLSTKDGQKVFQDEKDTVGKLQDLIKKGYQVATLQVAIGNLVLIDRILAEVAINECTDAKAQAKAQDELAKGDAEAANGKPENAVEHYRNAWDHATKK